MNNTYRAICISVSYADTYIYQCVCSVHFTRHLFIFLLIRLYITMCLTKQNIGIIFRLARTSYPYNHTRTHTHTLTPTTSLTITLVWAPPRPRFSHPRLLGVVAAGRPLSLSLTVQRTVIIILTHSQLTVNSLSSYMCALLTVSSASLKPS